MTAIATTHVTMTIRLPRRLHQQLERRVQRGSTLRGTLVRDLERYYWLMDQEDERWRHDDHDTYLLALAEIDLPTTTASDRANYPARAIRAITEANLHLVYHFDLVSFNDWLRAEIEQPIGSVTLLDLVDRVRNTREERATDAP